MTRSAGTASGARLAFALGLVTIVLMAMADFLPLPGGASVGQAVMLASVPIWLAAFAARRDRVFAPASRPAILVILALAGFLLVWAILSAMLAEELLRAGRVAMTLAALFAMLVFVAGSMTDARLRLTLITVTASVAGISLLSVVAYLVPPLTDLIFVGTDRAHGTFKHPNQYGIVLSTTMPLALVMCVLSRGRMRLFLMAAFALMIAGLMLSGSKTNMLIGVTSSMGLLFAFVALSLRGDYRLTALGAVAAVMLGALFGLYTALEALNPRALQILTTFLTGQGEVTSLNQRSYIYTISFQSFLDNPIFGEGAGKPLLLTPSGEQIQHSHNVLLDYARGMGLPGFVAMAALLGLVAMSILGLLGAIFLGAEGRLSDRMLGLALSVSVVNYTAANFISESFGPSTSVFCWLSVALMFYVRGRFRKTAPARAVGPPAYV